MPPSNDTADSNAVPKADGGGDLVTPWDVQAADDTGVDYDKLIERFGSSPIQQAG